MLKRLLSALAITSLLVVSVVIHRGLTASRDRLPVVPPEVVADLIVFARASSDSYLPAQELEAAGAKTHVFPKHDVQAVIWQRSDHQLVAIRGTASIRNALTDLRVSQSKDGSGVCFHAGFLDAAREIQRAAAKSLDLAKPIHLTGHSLGGAIALILGWHLTREGYKVARIVTFGQPKPGSRGLDRLAGLPIQRVTLDGDPVPLVPPTTVTERYRHVGQEFLFWGGVGRLVPPGDTFDGQTDFWINLPSVHPERHRIASYIQELGG